MPTDPPPDWVLTRRQDIGIHIRAAREAAGLTQIQLAEMAGLDHKTIHRIEYGTSDPTLGMLIRIAAALDTSVANLVRE
ncbi:helix-turn-helix transcriptional regulator [Streptomyces sp. IB2014 016-6]|uniref:helix-turn-helix domain-containing protein n=1 Tax=Streptomyces sp. IB2014 016-6 TaxID=2517818 RepID=UPI0011C8503E|nr:helix-turn-helix transcriptional regulator [Streptomyces sp. IB2014 016-6]TXL91565.1 XRE family transcriptional regulator [Streptomyces sp. IB2014 016-6]